MRIADKMNYDSVTRNIQKNRTDMSELQNQAATQKRVNKPSDDPVAAARVLGVRTESQGSEQFIKNIQSAKGFLEFSDQSLSELSETIVRLKELAIQQANDAGSSVDSKRAAAEEVAQTYGQAVQIGNRKFGERYIFGGFKTTEAPFTSDGNYYGDQGRLQIHVNKDAFMAMNIPGSQVFMGRESGNAGGTMRARDLDFPNAPGDKELTPIPPVEVQSVSGRGLAASPAIHRDGQAEVPARNLASMRPPNMAANMAETEEFHNGPEETGVNILATIKDFEIALRTNDKAEIQNSIDSLDQALGQVIRGRSELGARIQVLDHTGDSLHKAVVDNKVTASQLEDVDMFKVVSDISKSDATLKATMETSGRIVQPSLLDFIK